MGSLPIGKNSHPLGENLRTAQDTDLTRARDEVLSFLSFIESFGPTLVGLIGQGL